MTTHNIITIDGPSASGKSTVARRVAARLHRVYVDSGALYRGLTWQLLRDGVSHNDPVPLHNALKRVVFACEARDGAVEFTLDGADPSGELRSRAVADAVSDFAAAPEVRSLVVKWLRSMIQFGELVVEGRDIGSVVFPDAALKFYLDADPAERAQRRHSQLGEMGQDNQLDAVRQNIAYRDTTDSAREAAPLTVPDAAVVIDTTSMTVDDVVADVVSRVANTVQHRELS